MVNAKLQELETTTSIVRRGLQPFLQRGLIEQTSGDVETYRVCSGIPKKSTELDGDMETSINLSMLEQEGPQEMEVSPSREPTAADPQVCVCLRGDLFSQQWCNDSLLL